MCANYRPSSRDYLDHIASARWREDRGYPAEAYPGSPAPMLRKAPDGELEWCVGVFGLVPPWAKDLSFARKTYNARTETVASKPSYRNAWKHAQFCLVPMASFFEPNYESGKPVRWRIERADHHAFMVAAIWEAWRAPTGSEWVLSFSLVTVNADDNALMRRFHGPQDEKRSIAMASIPDWLNATPENALALLRPPNGGAFSAAVDPRPKKAVVTAATA